MYLNMFLSRENMNTVLKQILFTYVCCCTLKRLTYDVKGKQTVCLCLWDSFMPFLTNEIDKTDKGKKAIILHFVVFHFSLGTQQD